VLGALGYLRSLRDFSLNGGTTEIGQIPIPAFPNWYAKHRGMFLKEVQIIQQMVDDYNRQPGGEYLAFIDHSDDVDKDGRSTGGLDERQSFANFGGSKRKYRRTRRKKRNNRKSKRRH
jgi:hypothetical protein